MAYVKTLINCMHDPWIPTLLASSQVSRVVYSNTCKKIDQSIVHGASKLMSCSTQMLLVDVIYDNNSLKLIAIEFSMMYVPSSRQFDQERKTIGRERYAPLRLKWEQSSFKAEGYH